MFGQAIANGMQQRANRLVAKRESEQRATLVAGGHPRDPVIAAILGANESDSGFDVNRRSVLGYPAVWRAMTLLSGDIARTPLILYERVGETGKKRAVRHASFKLLRRKVNEETTAFQFKRTLQHHVLMMGNGYAFIDRNGAGVPRELWQLNPELTHPVRWAPADGGDSELWYVTKIGDEDRKIPADDIFHIKGMSYDGLMGYSPITVLMDALGFGLSIQKFGNVYFKNGSRADGVLTHPGKLGPDEKKNLRESWTKMHTGLDAQHRTAVLEGNMTYQQLTISNEEAQFLETRGFEIRQVSNIFGVPPHKLADDSRTSFSSLEQENQSYLSESLDPWYVTWEAEAHDKLLSESEKNNETHLVEFLREIMLRADSETETRVLVEEVNNGILTLNEARGKKNLEPVPGDEGDKFRIPLNIGVLGESTDDDEVVEVQPEEDDRSADVLDAQLAVVRDAAVRSLKMIGHKACRKAKDATAFLEWIDSGLDIGEMRESINGIMATAIGCVGHDVKAKPVIWSAFDALRPLVESCSADKLPAAVETLTRDWLTTIPDKVVADIRKQLSPKE